HHEGERPAAALGLLRPTPAAAFLPAFAEGRRPGQRQHVEVELARCVLSAVLGGPRTRHRQRRRRDQAGGNQQARHRSGKKHGTPLNLTARSVADTWNISRTKSKVARKGAFSNRRCRKILGSGSLAGRIERPVAVEPNHAPFDPLAVAGKTAILDDGVVQGVEMAIVELHGAAAIAARDIVGLPRPERDLMDVAIAHDSQLRIPEAAFLFLEFDGDLAERVLTGGDPAVIFGAGAPEIQLERIW